MTKLQSHPPLPRLIIIGMLMLSVACLGISQLQAQSYQESQSVDGGTLSWVATYSPAGSCPGGPISSWSTNQWSYTNGGPAVSLSGTTFYLVSPGGQQCPAGGNESGRGELGVADGITFYAQAVNGSNPIITTTQSSILDPAYKVTSILYDSPGNKSSNGFTNSTTTATTNTLGNSFTNASSVTFTEGFMLGGSGASASQTFGVSSTSSNSSAFTETFTNATGVSNQTAATALDATNHSQDLFLIWLNPELTVQLNGQMPSSYSVGLQSVLSGPGAPYADIVEVSASVMQANSAGVTTVPSAILNPQVESSSTNGTQTMQAGLAGICKQVNVSEYLAGACTLADQCGCTPSDFTPILNLDPLLTFSGTTSPLQADGSGATACQTPSASTDCRYIPVPVSKGSSSIATAILQGPNQAGGNTTSNTFTQTDATTTTLTQGGIQSQSVSASFKTGSPVFSLTTTDTVTFSENESTANSTGQANAQTITLGSSTVGCSEMVSIYEDTVFHTFVFQQPTGNYGCH